MPPTDDSRAESTARCERLLARSALLDTAGISWDRAADVEIEDDAIASLVYMRDVDVRQVDADVVLANEADVRPTEQCRRREHQCPRDVFGRQGGKSETFRGSEYTIAYVPKVASTCS